MRFGSRIRRTDVIIASKTIFCAGSRRAKMHYGSRIFSFRSQNFGSRAISIHYSSGAKIMALELFWHFVLIPIKNNLCSLRNIFIWIPLKRFFVRIPTIICWYEFLRNDWAANMAQSIREYKSRRHQRHHCEWNSIESNRKINYEIKNHLKNSFNDCTDTFFCSFQS
jgi:hypothetical protein